MDSHIRFDVKEIFWGMSVSPQIDLCRDETPESETFWMPMLVVDTQPDHLWRLDEFAAFHTFIRFHDRRGFRLAWRIARQIRRNGSAVVNRHETFIPIKVELAPAHSLFVYSPGWSDLRLMQSLPPQPDVPPSPPRACRVCGCTESNPCDGGCWWVEDDLCNRCFIPDIEATANILSLVRTREVALSVIEQWSEADRIAVCNWAAALHLDASDNEGIEIPATPTVIELMDRRQSGGGEAV